MAMVVALFLGTTSFGLASCYADEDEGEVGEEWVASDEEGPGDEWVAEEGGDEWAPADEWVADGEAEPSEEWAASEPEWTDDSASFDSLSPTAAYLSDR